jgi:hypothetical protein
MGYEQKLIIIRKFYMGVRHGEAEYYNQIIAYYDIAKLHREFDLSIFDKKLDGGICVPFVDGDIIIKEDRYGKELKYCTIDKLIKELNKCEKISHYRRIPPLIAMLKEFKKLVKNNEFENIFVVNYGY